MDGSWFSWLSSTIWNFLFSVGLANKKGKLLFLGLDNAGKTTLLNWLKSEKMQVLNPTLHPTAEEVTIGNLQFRIQDVGGHDQARRLWLQYLVDVNAIVYLVDITDYKRWEESRDELYNLLQIESISRVPILVLANKIDIFDGSPDKFLAQFDLDRMKNEQGLGGQRPFNYLFSSVANGMGIKEGFEWVGQWL